MVDYCTRTVCRNGARGLLHKGWVCVPSIVVPAAMVLFGSTPRW